MVHTLYVDSRSRSFNSKPVVVRGIATHVVGDNSGDVKCNTAKQSDTPHTIAPSRGKRSTDVGPISGVSNINENKP